MPPARATTTGSQGGFPAAFAVSPAPQPVCPAGTRRSCPAAAPTLPAARLRPFSSSLLGAFISLLPVLLLKFLLFVVFQPPRSPPCAAMGHMTAPDTHFWGKKAQGHSCAALPRSHLHPTCCQRPHRAWGQKYSDRAGKRKGGGEQGRLLKPGVVIKGKQSLMSSNARPQR